jgi:hypothetical protein
MQTPSSLSQLSHAEKHALILMLSEQITALQESVKQVQSRPKQAAFKRRFEQTRIEILARCRPGL